MQVLEFLYSILSKEKGCCSAKLQVDNQIGLGNMDLEQKKQFFGSLRDAQYKGLADPRLVVGGYGTNKT